MKTRNRNKKLDLKQAVADAIVDAALDKAIALQEARFTALALAYGPPRYEWVYFDKDSWAYSGLPHAFYDAVVTIYGERFTNVRLMRLAAAYARWYLCPSQADMDDWRAELKVQLRMLQEEEGYDP